MSATATRNGKANGAPTTERTDPVDSYKDAAPLLRRPFTPAAVKFKPQSVTKSGKTLVVAYIDARLVVERLNLVCPHLWFDEYSPVGNQQMWCHLTIDGIRRSDVGEGSGKALVSDALKRAAVRFGVGVSLYAVPQQYLDGEIKYLNDGHNTRLRGVYTAWLQRVGVQAFGEPLDHGDSDEPQGDPDADPAAHAAAPAPAPESDDAPLTAASRARVLKAFTDAGLDWAIFLTAAGIEDPDTLTKTDALKLREMLDSHLADAEAANA
jgi:hypothetical protein